jgi:hypothetical protein
MKKTAKKTKIELFQFWKDNKIDLYFTLTGKEIAEKFNLWLDTKEKSWIEYYGGFQSMRTFIGDKNGLKSVAEESELHDLYEDHLFQIYINKL